MTETLKGIAGSMFAGKTELLLREIKDNEIAGKKVQVFKPSIDTRWGAVTEIRSHSGGSHEAIPVGHPYEIIDHLDPSTDLVAIDEIQFFPEEIVEVVKFILKEDIRVVFAGLSADFRGEPFGSMPQLLSLCDEIDKPTAVCDQTVGDNEKCGARATKTQRLIDGEPAKYDDPIILIGAQQEYKARCVKHHIVPGKPDPNIK